eukprot:TRINITY_DN110171_c0_g1_i1.p1 TRINITY_DN110171_c0_g1~~TRINITY_DN110171_c0_g1_i1.p1  ORF type:complete len:389 (+),score=70.69 TRINITY_DN110171_c0_g1_i1:141-1169(+)
MRLGKLRRNLLRAGLADCLLVSTDGREMGSLVPETFDAVLVDVPCSCEGNVRKDPLSLWKSQMRGSGSGLEQSTLVNKQWEILQSGWRSLRPGGYLVYSTCTFHREENEEQCWRFLNETNGQGAFGPHRARPVDVADLLGIPFIKSARGKLDDSFLGAMRLSPHVFNAEGFFVSCFFKEPSASSSDAAPDTHSSTVLNEFRRLDHEESAALKELCLEQLGFWPESATGTPLLAESPAGDIWRLPDLGQGLDGLAAHSPEPGLLLARRNLDARLELTDELRLLSGNPGESSEEEWLELLKRMEEPSSKAVEQHDLKASRQSDQLRTHPGQFTCTIATDNNLGY